MNRLETKEVLFKMTMLILMGEDLTVWGLDTRCPAELDIQSGGQIIVDFHVVRASNTAIPTPGTQDWEIRTGSRNIHGVTKLDTRRITIGVGEDIAGKPQLAIAVVTRPSKLLFLLATVAVESTYQ